MGSALVIRSTSYLDPTGGQGMQITTEQAERILKASTLKARVNSELQFASRSLIREAT